MLPINPPTPPNPQILLKPQQQITTRHRPAREKVRSHPPALEIIRRAAMRENMHKQLPSRFQRPRDLGHKQPVVLHVLEELDGDDAVVGPWFKFVVHDVARYDGEVCERFGTGLRFDVEALGAGVGEGGDGGIGEELGKVER